MRQTFHQADFRWKVHRILRSVYAVLMGTKRLTLFPLSDRERKFLKFVYDTLILRGRLPRMKETYNHFGWVGPKTLYSNMIIRLTKKGWFHKSDHWGWWPVGVDREMKFHYPATKFIKMLPVTLVQLDDMPKADGDPETMHRLRSIAHLGELHPDDALTIRWAADTITELVKRIKEFTVTSKPTGPKGSHLNRVVTIPAMLHLLEGITDDALTEVDFAIHSENGSGA